MNREEQIIAEAKKYYSDSINCYNAFLHGVEWADEHPVDIWHDASEKPQGEYEIICQDEFEHIWLTDRREDIEHYENGWEECAACECIVRWAYISDLLPKGGGE